MFRFFARRVPAPAPCPDCVALRADLLALAERLDLLEKHEAERAAQHYDWLDRLERLYKRLSKRAYDEAKRREKAEPAPELALEEPPPPPPPRLSVFDLKRQLGR